MAATPEINISVKATPAMMEALAPLFESAGVKIEISGRPRVKIPAAAEMASCHPWTIREAIHSGHIPAYRMGKEIEIEVADLEEWIASKMVRPRKDERLLKNLHPKVAARLRKDLKG